MSNITEYELHTQGACHCLTPDYDGRDPMRNRPHSNGTDTTMMIRRYGLGREYAGNTGSPAITEQADGAYVRYEDHLRLQAACDAHNEMLVLRAKKAEGDRVSVPDGLIAALRNQRQIDGDGSEVAVSRQAVDEAADLLDKYDTSLTDGRAQHDTDPTSKEEYRRMFHAACADLGLINEKLGLDPDDGGAEPIIAAIEDLQAQQDADKVDAQPCAWYTDDNLSDKSATTWDKRVADRWIAKGWPVDPLYSAPVTAQTDPATAGDDREAFEEWHRNKFRTKLNSGQPTRDMHNGVYDDNYGPAHEQQMWEAWQASSKRVQPASREDA